MGTWVWAMPFGSVGSSRGSPRAAHGAWLRVQGDLTSPVAPTDWGDRS